MTDKILLREYKNHPKGYGLISDLVGVTRWDFTKEELSQYSETWEEFEEDPDAPPYCVGEEYPNWNEVPYVEIRVGTLRVYGLKHKKLHPEEFAEFNNWLPNQEQTDAVFSWTKNKGIAAVILKRIERVELELSNIKSEIMKMVEE